MNLYTMVNVSDRAAVVEYLCRRCPARRGCRLSSRVNRYA
jgi:hypothetical protein